MNRFVACLSAAVAACAMGCGTEEPVSSGDSGALNPKADAGTDSAVTVVPEAGVPDASTGPGPVMNCVAGSGPDQDKDGFTTEQGDCNDCDPNINPGAFDFPGNEYDEDCSGAPASDSETDCDNGSLKIDSTSAEDAARAIGLCKFTTAERKDWGIIEARFTKATGSGGLDSPLQVGLLSEFGAAPPRDGKTLLALSSGVARAPGQPGFTEDASDDFGKSILFDATDGPAGYPKASSTCTSIVPSKRIINQAALELKIRVPANANSLRFDNIFYSYEYPNFICSPFNDFFVALLTPNDSGDANIVFDSNKDPIGVNAGLLAVCTKNSKVPRYTCDQGPDLLKGTGFGAGEYDGGSLTPSVGGASTGWLTTVSPVKAGTVVTLRFAVWDTGDEQLDSTVLIDRFRWSVNKPTGATTVATPVLM